MQPHQERVVTEKRELDEKLEKLSMFRQSEIFKTIDEKERERLNHQFVLMQEYSSILADRIQNF